MIRGTQASSRISTSGAPALDDRAGAAVQRHDQPQQGQLPVGMAVHVLLVERALRQEPVLQDLGGQQHHALRIGQDVRTDQLDDLLQAVFALQDLDGFLAQFAPLGRPRSHHDRTSSTYSE
jgi:hypothetical protein